MRGFLKYAYEQNLLERNLALVVPKDNYKKQPKLPSTYSSGEIETMISAIDRGNSVGKRNYAIVLLAARLGLGASDIASLKFNNLLWVQSMIVLNQYKTGKRIELPILADVGNAIIDYLKNGRPKSTEPFVFLLARSPYTPIISSAVTGIVHSYFIKSGINISARRHGSHALRHSLAGILLEKETILPVISEVLGHKNTASTNYYLRIDLKSMRKCALEVPPVAGLKAENFGEQMSVDEKMIDEEFYTVMTNRQTGKIALLAETLSVTELNRLIDTIAEVREKVSTITADLSSTYEKFCEQSFPRAMVVADKFHVVKHIVEAVQTLRLRLKQQEIAALPVTKKERRIYEKQTKLINGESRI